MKHDRKIILFDNSKTFTTTVNNSVMKIVLGQCMANLLSIIMKQWCTNSDHVLIPVDSASEKLQLLLRICGQ